MSAPQVPTSDVHGPALPLHRVHLRAGEAQLGAGPAPRPLPPPGVAGVLGGARRPVGQHTVL